MKKLWFLDVTAEELNGKDVICLWMVDESGSIYAIYDYTHKDWVYVHGNESVIKEIFSILSSRYTSDDVKLELTERLLPDKKIKVLYISAPPKELQSIVKFLNERYRGLTFFEDDIRFSNKYLLARDLSPCRWYEVDYEIIQTEDNITKGKLKSLKPLSEEVTYPNMRILSIDVVLASPIGDPDPQTDPVLAISIYCNGKINQYVIKDRDDRDLIKKIIEDINKYDPHIIVSFEGNSYLWPYLVERCKVINIKLSVGAFDEEPHQSLYGHFSIPGRINIDLKGYVDNNPIFQRKTLEELAAYIGIQLPKKAYDKLIYFDAWNKERTNLLEYNRWRAVAIYKAFSELKEEIFSLSSITGMPADYVITASTGYQVENYIMRNAVKRGYLIIKPPQRWKGSYIGGLVFSPKEGLHKDVCVIDFKSMYPSIIMKYNISPDTITREPRDKVTFFDEVGVGVDGERVGLFTQIIKRLVDERDKVRLLMKKLPETSSEYRILDAHQRVLKIMANAMYGYMGWIGARYYSWEGAQLVTFLGRNTISKSKKKAEELGLKVLYGDTDSIFVNYDPEKVNRLLSWVNEELGLEAKIDRIYKVLLFTEAKKRYAGLTDTGKIDVVGLEYVRRDWCEYAKETQFNLIKLVLTGASKDKILDYFRERILKLDKGEVPIDQLIIWEQITKKLDEYKAMSPHLAVAEELSLKGWKIRKGMFIGYVILKGSGPLYKRAAHYTMAKKEDIDWDYYIYRQVIPAAARVLEPIGISKESLESIASGLHFSIDRFLG